MTPLVEGIAIGMMRAISNLLLLLFLAGSIYPVVELDNAGPEYITKYYRKALNSYKQRKFEASLNHIRHVIESNMLDYRLRYLAAHNHWRQGNYRDAVVHFRTAIGQKPGHHAAYIDLSLMLVFQKNYTTARIVALEGINAVKKAGKHVPAKLYNILARISLYRSNYNSALENAQSAKAAYTSAADDYKMTKSFVKDRLESILLEGRANLALGKFDNAELSFRWALSLCKQIGAEESYTQNLLGYLYEKKANKLADAEKKQQLRAKAKEHYGRALSSATMANVKLAINRNLQRVQ